MRLATRKLKCTHCGEDELKVIRLVGRLGRDVESSMSSTGIEGRHRLERPAREKW